MSRESIMWRRTQAWLGFCLIVSGILMSWATSTKAGYGGSHLLFLAPAAWGAVTLWRSASFLVRRGHGRVLVGQQAE
jgi:hypothetical protein